MSTVESNNFLLNAIYQLKSEILEKLGNLENRIEAIEARTACVCADKNVEAIETKVLNLEAKIICIENQNVKIAEKFLSEDNPKGMNTDTEEERNKCSFVVGIYDRMEVRSNLIFHCGENKQISWINLYTFYFKFCEGNEQIWIYNSSKNGLHQICNSVPDGILNKIYPRHSFVDLDLPGTLTQKNLGKFKGITVKEDEVFHCDQTKQIVWLNPLAFYFKWCEGNEQIWIYDAAVPGYLQLGQWSNSVTNAFFHISARTHQKEI